MIEVIADATEKEADWSVAGQGHFPIALLFAVVGDPALKEQFLEEVRDAIQTGGES